MPDYVIQLTNHVLTEYDCRGVLFLGGQSRGPPREALLVVTESQRRRQMSKAQCLKKRYTSLFSFSNEEQVERQREKKQLIPKSMKIKVGEEFLGSPGFILPLQGAQFQSLV